MEYIAPHQSVTRQQMFQRDAVNKQQSYGFKGRAFPLLAFIIGFLSFVLSYSVARSKNPPEIWPFPYTDILHPAIHYPEYLIFRVGMMVYPVLFAITFQTLKNFLQMKSFEIKGQADSRLQHFGLESVIACILLCVSTASISDGGDLNMDLYFYGSRGYWVLALFLIWKSSNVYSDLWAARTNNFVPYWSFKVKSYSRVVVIALIVAHILHYTKIVDFGYLLQWFVSFFILFFVFTLYWDLKNIDLLLKRK